MENFEAMAEFLMKSVRAIRSDPLRSAQIDDLIADRISRNDPGLALGVIKSGIAVHAAGYGLGDIRRHRAVNGSTRFHLASCGKQFTALGIVMLAEESRLHLDDPLRKYLPQLSTLSAEVTLRRLLHHTSGIRDFYDEDGVDEILARCERPTNADIIDAYANLGCPMAGYGIKPGDSFSYSNTGYELLGSVIESASGQSYRNFFRTRVFGPLGMRDTFSIPDRRAGDRHCATGYLVDGHGQLVEHGSHPFDDLMGAGSFYSTVLDLILYERALATNTLVRAASAQAALTSGRTNDGRFTNYGFGWYLGCDDDSDFADHEGEWIGFRAYMRRYLTWSFSVYVLSNNPALDLVEIADGAYAAYS